MKSAHLRFSYCFNLTNISKFPHRCFLDDVDDIGLIVSSVWSQGQYHKIARHCFLKIVCGQKISAQVDEYEGQALAKCVLQGN